MLAILRSRAPSAITNFNSANLNENQFEDTQYGMLALQRSINGFDGQISYFTRYDRLHFSPDPLGDLLINGVASDIVRQSDTNGIQADGSYKINPAHTIRAGFFFSGRTGLCRQYVAGRARSGGVAVDAPFTITDNVSATGYLAGAVCAGRMESHRQVHHQRRLALRPDVAIRRRQPAQPAHQLHLHSRSSTRSSTPAMPATSRRRCWSRRLPANIAFVQRHDGASDRPGTNPVLPERSHYFDAGVDQNIPFGCSKPAAKDCTDLDLGIDVYYKLATDLIDNGFSARRWC